MRKGFVLQVYLLIVAAEVTTSTLICPPGTTTLVTTEDVNDYSVEQDISSSFLTVISASPEFSDFFVASATPNTGYLQFKERFVLLGFSTTGQKIFYEDYRYVSQLIVKTNSSFPENYNYNGEYNVNSFEEIYFPFDEAVLTSKIEFTVLDVVSGSGTIYYWKLRLFGCREVNASQVNSAQAPSTSIVVDPGPLPSLISAPTIDSSAIIIQSSMISIQMSETSISSLSSRRKQETVTVTETVSSCSVSADVLVEGAVTGNTTAAGLAGAVVPLLVIIIILVTVLIFLLVLIYKRKRNHSENTRINKPTDVTIISVNQNEDDTSNNDLYLECSAAPGEDSLSPNNAGAAKLSEIQEGNNKSSTDPVYSNIESNDSTSKHEYEYMSLGRREGGDCSTLTHDIDSKMNPAYFSVQKEPHDYEIYVSAYVHNNQ